MSSFGPPTTFLSDLFLKNFRNIAEAKLSFGRGQNLFVGLNGHGKTNCLEAIALSCSLKPLQSLKSSDLIMFKEDLAKIKATFCGEKTLVSDIEIHPAGKKVKVNQKAIRNASPIARSIPLVSFIPAELNMVTGSAGLRRRALDQASGALFFEASIALRSYEKILLHRNRLLKAWPLDTSTLKTFTDMLIKEGAAVVYYRLKTIDKLEEDFSQNLGQILGQNFKGSISYGVDRHHFRGLGIADLSELLSKDQRSVEQEERRRRATLFGPHLDDIQFYIDEVLAKNFSSRGQNRAIVLSFKLAQMLAIHRVRGVSPIIILDDIVSELDAIKKQNLISVIDKLSAQTFFSATDVQTFGSKTPPENIFTVSDGEVSIGPIV